MGKKKSEKEFLRWFGPLLEALKELGGSAKPREASDKIIENLNLDDSINNEILISGQSKFYNQVAWARQYLVWEELMSSPKHGVWALTEKGVSAKIDIESAEEIVNKWAKIKRKAGKEKTEKKLIEEQENESPDDIDVNSNDLLPVLQSLSPSGFERICQRLLRESGFENVHVTGQSHDGGIDGYGTLEINPFVSFKVLFQCKRYKGTVSRAAVGDFRNAMMGRAEKGIIITTGTFSRDAIKEANRDGATPVELVDGEKLIKMFENVELGLKPRKVYEIDLPFFKPFME